MYAYAYTYPARMALDPLFGNFTSFVAGDGGVVASTANVSRVIDDLRKVGLLDSASLVCTCDSGKTDKLYYILISASSALLQGFINFVTADSGTFASQQNTIVTVQALDRAGFFMSASLVCTCDAGKTDKLYYIAP